MPKDSKTNVIKSIIFTFIIGGFIIVGLNNSGPVKVNIDEKALVAVEEMRANRGKESRESIVASLNENEAYNDSGRLLSDVEYESIPDEKAMRNVRIEETTGVVCPQFMLPVMPKLPQLPAQEVLVSVTRDQLNYILYQHIKEHQTRTIEMRKLINKSYARYLETCN